MDGYSVKEAASILGIPKQRVWELIARGVLAGRSEVSGAMRVFLQPQPESRSVPLPETAPAAQVAAPTNGNGNGGASGYDAAAFRELLTEFRNLTERYGQALLALGEARGEVAALRTRVELLEARVDLRLPGPSSASSIPWQLPDASPSIPDSESTASPAAEPALAEAAATGVEPGAMPTGRDAEPATDTLVAAVEVPTEHGRRPRRKRGGSRSAVEGIAQALARADDPSGGDLPGGAEAEEALKALASEIAATPTGDMSQKIEDAEDVMAEPALAQAIEVPDEHEAAAASAIAPEASLDSAGSLPPGYSTSWEEPDWIAEEDLLEVATAPEPDEPDEPVSQEPMAAETAGHAAMAAEEPEPVAGEPEPAAGEHEPAADWAEWPAWPMASDAAPLDAATTIAPAVVPDEWVEDASLDAAAAPAADEAPWVATVPPSSEEGGAEDRPLSEAEAAWVETAAREATSGADEFEASPADATVAIERAWEPELAGPELAGPELAGPEMAGPELAEPVAQTREPDQSAAAPTAALPAASSPPIPAIGTVPRPAATPEASDEEELMWLGDEFGAPTDAPAFDRAPMTTTARPAAGTLPGFEDTLGRMATERGWEASEIAAIRALLAGPSHVSIVDEPGVGEVSLAGEEAAQEHSGAEESNLDTEPMAGRPVMTALPIGEAEITPPPSDDVSASGADEMEVAVGSAEPTPEDATNRTAAAAPSVERRSTAWIEPGPLQGLRDAMAAVDEGDELLGWEQSSRAVLSSGDGPVAVEAPDEPPEEVTWLDAAEIDDSEAPIEPQSAAGAPEPDVADPAVPTPAPRDADAAVPTFPSALARTLPQQQADWLRGRRGPAVDAYRRLRRLFPG